jgi:hypothetical protein
VPGRVAVHYANEFALFGFKAGAVGTGKERASCAVAVVDLFLTIISYFVEKILLYLRQTINKTPMKKFTLLFLFFSLAAMAQESFPYKKPILMLNKTVTVIRIPSSEQFGYYDFYEDKKCYKTYKEVRVSTPEKELLGRSFTITAIDSTENTYRKDYRYVFTLTDNTETIYYNYIPHLAGSHYSLEVKGGLDLPDGFYCDFIEKSKYDYSASVPEIQLSEDYNKSSKKNEYYFTFTFFDKFEVDGAKNIILLLENNKTIEKKINGTTALPQGKDFKYNFTILLDDKDIELLKANKLTGIKLQDSVHTFHPGTGVTLSGILTCMQSLPTLK